MLHRANPIVLGMILGLIFPAMFLASLNVIEWVFGAVPMALMALSVGIYFVVKMLSDEFRTDDDDDYPNNH